MAILKLTDICKDYVQGKEPVRVLKNVNLTVEKGDYLAIMGPSGSGKTTLMNIIGCLDVPTSGSYELDGRNLRDLSDDALAEIRNKHLGFVFQSFYLMPKLTALDNVALPLLYAGVGLKERRERAAEALKSVGLEERMAFLPNQLSGGQCQRVAIARAMVGKPDLLLADEPTGALDTKAGNQIMDIFRRLSGEGMTIIMITHEPAIARCADKIYHILDGQLRTDVEPREGGSEDEAQSE
ncbi:MAG: ABC transporter ATP-binding protein [Firmicutes bacterium]|nr:ABC transporter ATP-binding protein [Bacillota bacterium]